MAVIFSLSATTYAVYAEESDAKGIVDSLGGLFSSVAESAGETADDFEIEIDDDADLDELLSGLNNLFGSNSNEAYAPAELTDEEKAEKAKQRETMGKAFDDSFGKLSDSAFGSISAKESQPFYLADIVQNSFDFDLSLDVENDTLCISGTLDKENQSFDVSLYSPETPDQALTANLSVTDDKLIVTAPGLLEEPYEIDFSQFSELEGLAETLNDSAESGNFENPFEGFADRLNYSSETSGNTETYTISIPWDVVKDFTNIMVDVFETYGSAADIDIDDLKQSRDEFIEAIEELQKIPNSDPYINLNIVDGQFDSIYSGIDIDYEGEQVKAGANMNLIPEIPSDIASEFDSYKEKGGITGNVSLLVDGEADADSSADFYVAIGNDKDKDRFDIGMVIDGQSMTFSKKNYDDKTDIVLSLAGEDVFSVKISDKVNTEKEVSGAVAVNAQGETVGFTYSFRSK
ncbi:MAG: hypothetical protein Q4C42_02775 [Clostridia bacterium]|nr:hypothetical protein [Clostridia bacterium]